MPRLLITAAAAALTMTCLTAELRGQTTAAPPPAMAASLLPPGPGHDTMVRVCSTCHTPEIAARQRLTPAGWHELVETMVGRGAQGSDADFAEITGYLTKNFPDQPGKK